MPSLKSPLVVGKVSAPKSYDLLAAQLREAILSGEVPEGSNLPPERELILQTGLSRGSVREGLRILAAEGLVTPKQGRHGGYAVSLPGSDGLAQFIDRFVRGRRISVRTLHEVRELIEPALARFAAMRRTEEDLARIRARHAELVAAAGSFRHFSIANLRWHLAVAEASGNELLATFLKSISSGVAAATTTEEYDTGETREAVIQVHLKIIQAVENRDGEGAERFMRGHLAAATARALGHGPGAGSP